MTGTKQDRIRCLFLVTLALCARPAVFAQSGPAAPPPHSIQIQSPPSGSLAGRLTDLHSAPLAGVSLVLRNQATGAELRATTQKNGVFRIPSLAVGEYTLEADEPRLGRGQIEGIVVSGGVESRVQAAMRFEPAAPAPTPPASLAVAASDRIAAPASAAAERSASPPAFVAATAVELNQHEPSPASLAAASFRYVPPLAAIPPQTVSAPGPALIAAVTGRVWPVASRSVPAPAPQPNPSREFPGNPAIAPTASSTLPQPAANAPAIPQLHAALETQSAPIESALALAVPRTLSLPEQIGPELLLSDMVAEIDEIMLHSPTGIEPIAGAPEKPDPVSPAVDSTLTAAQLQALPVSGRRWQEFLLDEPAATASPDATQPSFRGASPDSAELTVEGVSTRLAFGGSAGAPDASDPSSQESGQENAERQGWGGGRGLGVSEAAIREVTTAAGNVEAESMRSPGGRTAIRTESGGDALHGQGFLFDRQNTWGARNPYTQWVTETSQFEPFAQFNATQFPVFDNFQYSNGQPGPPQSYTPPDHETVWGLGVGSRIRRDKLFWFAALDSYHRNDAAVSMVKHPYLQTPSDCGTPPCAPVTTGFFAVPSEAQMQLLSAQLDLGSANPDAEGLTAYSQMLEKLAGLLGPAPRTAAQWIGFGRLDWQAAERHRFTLEGAGDNWNAPGGGLTRVSESYGNHSFGSSQAGMKWLQARWEAYLTPNLLAVTQGSAARINVTARPDTPSSFEQEFMNGNFSGQLPEIVVDNRYGFTIGNPSRFGQGSYPDERSYDGREMLDWIHNKLLVRAGFELDHNADATSLLRNQSGTYVYSKVENFISDALAFEKYGFADALDENNPHNCDVTGKPWYTPDGQLMGLGAIPCYSHYSQTVGPTNWHLSTNDWASYATAQWQASKLAVLSAGLRWELEQMPPPIAALANPELTSSTPGYSTPPFSANLPSLGSNWGPRVSLAVGQARSHWPVLRLGYGMYYGRVENTTILTALTHTGSLKGDLDFFMRPQHDSQYGPGGAPPFPYVFAGQPASVVKPGVVGFAPNFRNPEVHQAIAAIEESLPAHVQLTAEAMLSLGRRLPVSIDTNIDPSVNPGTITYYVCDQTPSTSPGSTNGQCGNMGLGPIKAPQITVPYYADWPAAIQGNCPVNAKLNTAGQCGRLNPDYQQIVQIMSRANSTYEAAMVKVTRYGRRGLSFHAHYTYAHTMDWNPDGITLGANSSVLAPPSSDEPFSQEYGASNLDVRHAAAVMAIFEAPWKLRGSVGRFANGWMLSGIGQFRSGLPYSMRITGSLPGVTPSGPGNGNFGLGPSMNGYGGDNRYFGLPRNSFRYPQTWKADLRLGKRFNLGEMRQIEILAETFNLFNHQNVTEIETTGYYIEPGSPPSATGGSATPPTLNFLDGLHVNPKTGLPSPAFGQPLNINGADFYRERQIQFGLRLRF